jgi:hypothetical protein
MASIANITSTARSIQNGYKQAKACFNQINRQINHAVACHAGKFIQGLSPAAGYA